MASKSEQVADALDDLAKAVGSSGTGDQLLSDSLGWNAPPLSRANIQYLATSLATRLRRISDVDVNTKYNPSNDISKIEFVKTNVIPHLWNGNGIEAFRAYQGLIDWLDSSFNSVSELRFDWERAEKKDELPKELARKIRSLRAQINKMSSDTKSLKEHIDTINSAHDAALSLPTDLESLEEARQKIEEAQTVAEKARVMTEDARERAEKDLEDIKASSQEAAKLVENTSDSYRAATTKGLSESFQTRADQTAKSMWVWVFGLLVALTIGAFLGYRRVGLVQELLEKNASGGLVTASMFFTLFSIAAPVWFAWVATKQIGQRFRLSEDYAFKASVAKAYEGYRREAAKLDPTFSARLFASALDRLEEAPMRFVEHETFGSPWHEAMDIREKIRRRKARSDRAAKSSESTAEDEGGASDEDERDSDTE